MTTTTTIPGQQLRLYGLEIWCDMGVGIGGDRWPAAELFCDFVLDDAYHAFFHTLFLNRRVIELGAGNGMAGILIGKLFSPSEVVITDLADHLGLIEHNITLNTHTTIHGVDNKDNTKAFVLDWLSPHVAEKMLGKFDIVFALECIYREPLYGPLIETLHTVCHDDTIVFLGLTRSFGNSLYHLCIHTLSVDMLILIHPLPYILIWVHLC